MRILLDTHIFLWFISGDTQLSMDVRDAIRDPNNEVYLSAISVWEAIVKYQLGKLPLPEDPEMYLPKQRDLHPFDRMLICQALEKGLTIATVDAAVRAYSVSVL